MTMYIDPETGWEYSDEHPLRIDPETGAKYVDEPVNPPDDVSSFECWALSAEVFARDFKDPENDWWNDL